MYVYILCVCLCALVLNSTPILMRICFYHIFEKICFIQILIKQYKKYHEKKFEYENLFITSDVIYFHISFYLDVTDEKNTKKYMKFIQK